MQYKAGTREEMAKDIGDVVRILVSRFDIHGKGYFLRDKKTRDNFLEVMQRVERFIDLGNFKASDLGVSFEKLITLRLIAEEIQETQMLEGGKKWIM